MASQNKKKWRDLSPIQQKAIMAGGVAEAILTSYALGDLRSRPAKLVRGPRALWMLAFAVQPFGPLAYLTKGRRPGTAGAGKDQAASIS